VEIFANLPSWAAVLLSVLAAIVLVALNIGWLLQAKALLEARRKPKVTNRQDTKTPRP
jgi:hypothetical protein